MVTIGRKCLYQNNILGRDYYLKLSDNPFIYGDEINGFICKPLLAIDVSS